MMTFIYVLVPIFIAVSVMNFMVLNHYPNSKSYADDFRFGPEGWEIDECKLCTLNKDYLELTKEEFFEYVKENEINFEEIYERAKNTKIKKNMKGKGKLTKPAIKK